MIKSLADALMAFEAGDSTDEEAIELFQYLIDTGLELQGSYGRIAKSLVERGLVTVKGEKDDT